MNIQAPPYRDATDEVANHAKRLLAERRETDLEKLGTLYRHRVARIAFGWVGSLSAIASLIVIAAAEEGQVLALGLAWLAAFAGGIAGYVIAKNKFKTWREREEGASDEPHAVVLRLTKATSNEEEGPQSLNRIDDLALDSHRLPLLVGAMLLPLTCIVLFMLLCGAHQQELDQITRFAFLYTVHVHVYAAIAAWHYPKKRRAAAMIGIAALLGVLPFVLSSLVVGVVASFSAVVYYLPLTWWVDRETQWIATERLERIVANHKPAKQSLAPAAFEEPVTFEGPARNTAAVASPL